ncbi:MAG: flippase [Halothece sp.]
MINSLSSFFDQFLKHRNNRLAKAITGSFGLSIGNAFLNYLISWLLARFLGAQGYGAYAYALAWIKLLLLPAGLGLGGIVIREVAIYTTREQWNLARGLLGWSNKIVFYAAAGLALLAGFLTWVFQVGSDPQMLQVLLLSMIALPFLVLSKLRQSAMQALNYVVVGQFPEMLIRPTLLVIFFIAVYFLSGEGLTASSAMIIYVISSGITFGIGAELLRRRLPEEIQTSQPQYQSRFWLKSALPMLFISGMYLINNQTDTLMLGAIQDSASVGLYTVANRGALVITFILMAVNTSVAPTFARLYAEGNREKLQKVVTKSCYVIILGSLPIALLFIIFGKWFLLLFGSEFVAARTTLTILAIGQLVNAGTGSVGLLLNMTGYERYTAIGVSISALINVILNFHFISQWGAEGAALATVISTVIWNIILVVFVYQKLGIYPTAFGKFLKNRS